eukprot:765325-Hanusia_phi.AAC.1
MPAAHCPSLSPSKPLPPSPSFSISFVDLGFSAPTPRRLPALLSTYRNAARRRPEIRTCDVEAKPDWKVSVQSDGAECLSNIHEARRKQRQATEGGLARLVAEVGRAER